MAVWKDSPVGLGSLTVASSRLGGKSSTTVVRGEICPSWWVDMGIGRLLLLTTSYQHLVQPARLNFVSGVGPAGRGWICKGARGGAGQLLRRAGIIAHFGFCQLARKEVDARGIVISSAMKKFYALERGAQYVKSVALDSIPFVCVPLKQLLHD